MFAYLSRLYKQIYQIYQIKKHLDVIYKGFDNGSKNDDIKQIAAFESLKITIFSCGSLYIKLFQWYISKLKANVANTPTLANISKSYNCDNCDNCDNCENCENCSNCDKNNKYDNETQNIIKFIKYFEDIFEQCPYHDIEHTQKIFKESMNEVMDDLMNDMELYDYIEKDSFKPIASGSIGQVYYGRRKSDGMEVAIKIKHPNIELDLTNQYELIQIIKIFQSITYFRNRYNMHFNIDDFLADINLQCDFNNEANNCKTFIENFKDSSDYIVFPKIIYQTKNLLISEYIEGESFDNLTSMQKYNTTINYVCFFYQMLLVDNFIHGDLHCKNWKVRINKKTKNPQIIVYDCGICFKNINIALSKQFWFSLVKYDVSGVTKVLRKLVYYTKYGVDGDDDDNGDGDGNDGNGNDGNDGTDGNDDINNVDSNDNICEKQISLIFDDFLNKSMGTSVIIKSIINLFRANNITVHKFLLNISILMCVTEEFLRLNNIISKDNEADNKSSMFEIINDNELDIIAFCDVKKCYPKVRDLLMLNKKNKLIELKENIDKNNINEITKGEKRLFGSILLSGLTFKPPE